MRLQNKITTIAFDADDTLWVNEPYFQAAEQAFISLLKDYESPAMLSHLLYQTEVKNLPLYGYGVKGFILCMLETANQITKQELPPSCLAQLIELGHDLLQKPIELLTGVEHTLTNLSQKYRLILATKGDLFDQKRKINHSQLAPYFQHIEIMSDKKKMDYQYLLQHLSCPPEQFLMVGNSINSDILPVLELGAYAGYIPYHVTWTHEQHDILPEHNHFIPLHTLTDLLSYL